MCEHLNITPGSSYDAHTLKDTFQGTWVQQMKSPSTSSASEFKNELVSAWSIIADGYSGPCRLKSDDHYLSISVIDVNVNGTAGKLFIVRDISTLMDIQ